ncbi:MAG: hypothetical protein RR891_08105 [Clostridium sp.]|uniref:hypothetical protein n=1 Tax=Clostridium sp. TaxID=1506 RepID=UPI0030395A59
MPTKNNVDKDPEFLNQNLIYRKKFIRTIYTTVIDIILLIFVWIYIDNFAINIFLTLSFPLVAGGQLIYTYVKWKSFEEP